MRPPRHLARNALAGLTLAALGLPQAMGYTRIIGTPVVTGLYTFFLPVLAFALLGSSRHLVVAADSATAAIVAAGLVGVTAGSSQYTALCGLVALVSGALLMLARAAGLAFLADFLSRTVLIGFLTGVGVQIAGAELHGMLGVPKEGTTLFGVFLGTLRHLDQAHPPSLLVTATVLVAVAGGARMVPRFPAALVVAIGMIVASAHLDLGATGMALVGSVPAGLPPLGVPATTAADLWRVLPIAFSCTIVILAQSAATSRAYAVLHRERVDENGDLLGLAAANAAAGLSGTFVVNGSPTQTTIVDAAGGTNQTAQLVTVGAVLVVLLLLTRPLALLPIPVLASIVFLAGVRLVNLRALRDLAARSPEEFRLAILTALVVVLGGVEPGILLAMALSLFLHVRHGYRPHTAVLVHDPDDQVRMEPVQPGRMLVPGLVMYWFGAALYYANAPHFAEDVRRLVDASPLPVRWLVVDTGAVTTLDYTASEVLRELQRDLERGGVTLALARVSNGLQADLDRLRLHDALGPARIFASRRECLAAYAAAARA